MNFHRKPPEGNVRRVRSFAGNLCGVITNKVGQIVQFESFGERSLLLDLERDQTVRDYRSQPETLVYQDQAGRVCHYTPDFVVWRTTGETEIHEVTVSERRSKASAIGREQAAQAACRARGWQYLVHMEQDLPGETEVANLLRLYPYRVSGYVEKAVQDSLPNWLAQSVSLTVLAAHLTKTTRLPTTRIWGALFHQLWHGGLGMDWQRTLLDNETVVVVWQERQE